MHVFLYKFKFLIFNINFFLVNKNEINIYFTYFFKQKRKKHKYFVKKNAYIKQDNKHIKFSLFKIKNIPSAFLQPIPIFKNSFMISRQYKKNLNFGTLPNQIKFISFIISSVFKKKYCINKNNFKSNKIIKLKNQYFKKIKQDKQKNYKIQNQYCSPAKLVSLKIKQQYFFFIYLIRFFFKKYFSFILKVFFNFCLERLFFRIPLDFNIFLKDIKSIFISNKKIKNILFKTIYEKHVGYKFKKRKFFFSIVLIYSILTRNLTIILKYLERFMRRLYGKRYFIAFFLNFLKIFYIQKILLAFFFLLRGTIEKHGRTITHNVEFGKLSLQSFFTIIYYDYIQCYQRHGVFGLHFWIRYSNILR